jgi:hypothetical protein
VAASPGKAFLQSSKAGEGASIGSAPAWPGTAAAGRKLPFPPRRPPIYKHSSQRIAEGRPVRAKLCIPVSTNMST